MIFSFLLSPVLALSLPAAEPPVVGADSIGPPGLVLIEGGSTTIGSDTKDIEKLLEEDHGTHKFVRVLHSETPEHRVTVADYYLMVTEVTNEQYREFVAATGHRPPFEWGRAAIDAASRSFLEEEGRKAKEAREANKKYEMKKFDAYEREKWWTQNWAGATWEMPAEDALKPVTHVDYADAQAYCAWAGLRLQTEAEFQRAVRGKTKNYFPWGAEWKSGRVAATSETRTSVPLDVGSFADGVSKEGVYDLAGNVWEWTSTPYDSYPKYKDHTYSIKTGSKQKLEFEVLGDWDANARVSVGGSFQNEWFAARATTRRNTVRDQITFALGFRCAATPGVGIDVSQAAYELLVRNSPARPSGAEYKTDRPIAMDRWQTRAASEKAPEGYEVISAYEYISFTPLAQIEHTETKTMEDLSRTEPVHLGYLTTSVPLLEPALEPGTYLVAYRGEGELRQRRAANKDEEGEEIIDPLAGLVDNDQENYVFFDAGTGSFKTAVAAASTGFDNADDVGSVSILDEKVWEDDPSDPKEKVQVIEKWVSIESNIPSPVRKRAYTLRLKLKPNPQSMATKWRMK